MKTIFKSIAVAAVFLAAVAQQVSAAVLLGTVGGGNDPQSTLVMINPNNGALMRTIGPVGYIVNGMAWDERSQKLYATTSVKDKRFHGLITINRSTGAGTPVNSSVVNFGLPFGELQSPILAISIDSAGRMVGWYREFPPATTDTFVKINKSTGIATEFPDSGVAGVRVGLSFSQMNALWLFDSPTDGRQTAYKLNPNTGKLISSQLLTPPIAAALGDFNPENDLYYGVNKDPFGEDPTAASFIIVNPRNGQVRDLGPTIRNLHTLAFVKASPPLFRGYSYR